MRPLGMTDTMFRPPKSLRARIAPTERISGSRKRMLHGEVHDENASAMGGIAGHAGMFSTGPDLAIFCQMLLNGGIYAHRAHPAAPNRRGIHLAGSAGEKHAHAGLERAHGALFERPVFFQAELRPYRIHRHVHMDRSTKGSFRCAADECESNACQSRRRRDPPRATGGSQRIVESLDWRLDGIDESPKATRVALRFRVYHIMPTAISSALKNSSHRLAATERRNPRSQRLDQLTTRALLKMINREDRLVPRAVATRARPDHARRGAHCQSHRTGRTADLRGRGHERPARCA